MSDATPQPSAMGRPTKLTYELVDALAADLELGLTYNLACDANGIDRDTFHAWRAGEFPEKTSKRLRAYFSDTIARANAKAARKHLGYIEDAARDSESGREYRASAWLLEHRFRDEYGTKAVEVSGPGNGPLTVVFADREDGPA